MMHKQKWILVVVLLLMMGGTVGVLARLRTNQKLGQPGVKTVPLPDSQNLEVCLPEQVSGYTSERLETDTNTSNYLPQDTSYGQRRYTASDGFSTVVTVVLMGADRTSIHKPQFCLTGSGWKIDDPASSRDNIPIDRPQPYDLPVMKIVATKEVTDNGSPVRYRGIYIYWFVADNLLSGDPSGFERMLWTGRELLTTGVLTRWAYVSFFTACPPGREQETYERMKNLIAASVPEFQLTPRPKEQIARH